MEATDRVAAASPEKAEASSVAVDPKPTAKHAIVDGREVHYTASGSGKHTLALVHGWASDQRAWWKNTAQLAQHFRVLAIDLPGHGQSDEPAKKYSMGVREEVSK